MFIEGEEKDLNNSKLKDELNAVANKYGTVKLTTVKETEQAIKEPKEPKVKKEKVAKAKAPIKSIGMPDED